ncbi:hypothetical protein CspeluHIS016_0403670 [Cutaneotrichosporon spelunceum]|uniref:Uncharacterized protein n=1 Tax=Cutaneotrichosporon spelunceum TaxID=1672016 RepID=A0AAD3YCU9_9TREE|nr:hypothetical protein CspeluHIS016_0403670 [Cutaneotrichosporon spelunceum]
MAQHYGPDPAMTQLYYRPDPAALAAYPVPAPPGGGCSGSPPSGYPSAGYPPVGYPPPRTPGPPGVPLGPAYGYAPQPGMAFGPPVQSSTDNGGAGKAAACCGLGALIAGCLLCAD